MGGFARYGLEGLAVEIPLRRDERSGRETEDYGPFLELSPLYTPEGRPILLAIEDACPYADMADDDLLGIECGACACFRQPPGSLLGICRNERMRSGPEMSPGAGESEE